jgi:hypothetical protein
VEKAMRAIRDERDIETRCQTFFSRFEAETNQCFKSLQDDIDNMNVATGRTKVSGSTPTAATISVTQPTTNKTVAQETPNIPNTDIAKRICACTSGKDDMQVTQKRLGKKPDTNTETPEHRPTPDQCSYPLPLNVRNLKYYVMHTNKEQAKAQNEETQNDAHIYIVRGQPWYRKLVKVKRRNHNQT